MWPAVFKVSMEGPSGPTVAYLCIFCIIEIRKCLAALSEATEEERKLLEQSAPSYLEKAQISRIEGPGGAP